MSVLRRILLRRGTTAAWAAANPVLKAGEPGYDMTARVLKVGDGTTGWTALPGLGGGTSTEVDLSAYLTAEQSDTRYASATEVSQNAGILANLRDTVEGLPAAPDLSGILTAIEGLQQADSGKASQITDLQAMVATLQDQVASLLPVPPTYVVPSGPAFNVAGLTISIPDDEGVVYYVDGSWTEPGLVTVTPPATVVVTAQPKTGFGYAFPDNPYPQTEWTQEFAAASDWDLVFADTLTSGSLVDRLNVTASGDTAITGGWAQGHSESSLTSTIDAGSPAHAVEFEYDLTTACEGAWAAAHINYAWGRHVFKVVPENIQPSGLGTSAALTSSGTAVTPVLTPAAGKSLTGLPLAGKFRAESDGTVISLYVNDALIATTFRSDDNNPSWAGSPNTCLLNAYIPGNNIAGAYFKIRNFKVEKK